VLLPVRSSFCSLFGSGCFFGKFGSVGTSFFTELSEGWFWPEEVLGVFWAIAALAANIKSEAPATALNSLFIVIAPRVNASSQLRQRHFDRRVPTGLQTP